jgi:hypothetical protein
VCHTTLQQAHELVAQRVLGIVHLTLPLLQ